MTTQAQPESPTIEAFDGSSLPGLLDADELLAVGFLRLRLHAHAHQVVSDRVRQALAALEQAGRAIHSCYRDGDDGGLPAGCHYFPTNDLAGTCRNSDGHHEGLWFAKTWDYRAGSNPGWPQAAGVARALSDVVAIFSSVAAELGRQLASHGPRRAHLGTMLSTPEHNGTVQRTMVSCGPVEGHDSRERRTRHAWHTDATLLTVLATQDFSRPRPSLSSHDQLIGLTRAGHVESLATSADEVIVLVGRYLPALLEPEEVPALRHAVVSERLSPRAVTMLRVGFDPAAPELLGEHGRPLQTRDGVDVSSGKRFYAHLAKLGGAPIFIGSPRPAQWSLVNGYR